MVPPSLRGPIAGVVGQFLLLAALALTVGLGVAGWVVGLSCALVTGSLLAVGMRRAGRRGLGPADRVTLARTVLVGGVAALVAESLAGETHAVLVVGLSAVALVLDGVDGWVARRTKSSSALGARFDMEVDAFLILVLSVFVAQTYGAWVLVIGLARYAFVAAGWLLPWLRGSLPPRYWRKVVAAAQGIVLTVVAAGVVPSALAVSALVVALLLLVESFGRDVWWLWRHRDDEAPVDEKSSESVAQQAGRVA